MESLSYRSERVDGTGGRAAGSSGMRTYSTNNISGYHMAKTITTMWWRRLTGTCSLISSIISGVDIAQWWHIRLQVNRRTINPASGVCFILSLSH